MIEIAECVVLALCVIAFCVVIIAVITYLSGVIEFRDWKWPWK